MFRRDRDKKTSEAEQVVEVEKAHAREEGVDVLSELGDIVLTSFLTDAPVLGMAVKAFRGVQSVRDAYFMRKLNGFLIEPSKVSEEKRAAFQEKLQADPEFCKKTTDHLVAVLDRLDDAEKAPYLTRIFLALVAGNITPDQLRRFCMMLERATLSDLRTLQRFVEGGPGSRLTREEFDGLEGVGLAAIQHSIMRPPVNEEAKGHVDFGGGTDLPVIVSPTGRRFVEVAMVGRKD